MNKITLKELNDKGLKPKCPKCKMTDMDLVYQDYNIVGCECLNCHATLFINLLDNRDINEANKGTLRTFN